MYLSDLANSVHQRRKRTYYGKIGRRSQILRRSHCTCTHIAEKDIAKEDRVEVSNSQTETEKTFLEIAYSDKTRQCVSKYQRCTTAANVR